MIHRVNSIPKMYDRPTVGDKIIQCQQLPPLVVSVAANV